MTEEQQISSMLRVHPTPLPAAPPSGHHTARPPENVGHENAGPDKIRNAAECRHICALLTPNENNNSVSGLYVVFAIRIMSVCAEFTLKLKYLKLIRVAQQ